MTPEGKVKQRVTTLLKQYDIWYFMPAANGYGVSGIPDYICCAKGKFLAIECKAPGNKPTALQRRAALGIQEHGGWAYVQYGEDTHVLEEYLRTFAL